MQRFEDKVAIVSGAASGIGKATAERLASEGAKVACLDVQAEAAAGTAKAIQQKGGEAVAIVCDVSDPQSVADAVAKTLDTYGKLDSLCNIAGIIQFGNTHEVSLETWKRVLDVNLTGTFLMSQHALPHLLADGGGSIVNTSSTAALKGQAWTAAYSASKGGVQALTYVMAVEYGKQHLRVNAVNPGSIKTAMMTGFQLPDGADMSLVQRTMALDKPRGPEYAASVFAFLASDDAAHINGETIRVDGGALA